MDLFPFKPREEQKRMLSDCRRCIKSKTSLLAHAPTGIGKTAAVLAPSLEYALENNKSIFFLTSRHSQHRIAIDTLKLIKTKFKIEFQALDLIGKRWMCPVVGVKDLKSREFKDFCDSVRKTETCPFYKKSKKSC
jgi:DNA excision repair protein ERCC-2